MVPSIDGFKPCVGGSPLNTAVAIARLETDVAFLGRLSKDFFGDMFVDTLSHNGVVTKYITRSDQLSTLAFVHLAQGKEPQYVFYTEGTADRSLVPSDVPHNLDDVDCICFGSIAMTMEPVASTVERLIQREHTKKVISFDPNIRPMMIPDTTAYIRRFETWLSYCTILKISEADVEFLFPEKTLEQAVAHLLSCGPKLLVMTLGSKGALAVLNVRHCEAHDDTRHCEARSAEAIQRTDRVATARDDDRLSVTVPVKKVDVVDTIGAGDTFHGAFLSWLAEHNKMTQSAIASLTEDDLRNALSYANLAAAIVCTRQGAQPPTKKEMLEH